MPRFSPVWVVPFAASETRMPRADARAWPTQKPAVPNRRREITTGGQAAPVTLSYQESGQGDS